MPKLHSADVKAGVVAALLAGSGINEVARVYKVPKQTVSRWRDEVNGTNQPAGTGRSGTRRWAPDPNEGDFWHHLDGLGKEYIVGLRTLVRYLTDPDVLVRVPEDYDGYAAVVAAHESLGARVAGFLQAGASVEPPKPALPDGDASPVDAAPRPAD